MDILLAPEDLDLIHILQAAEISTTRIIDDVDTLVATSYYSKQSVNHVKHKKSEL